MVTSGHYLDYCLLFSSKYGAIVERYISSCRHPPVLLIFDFFTDAIYHSSVCGDKLSPNEVEKFVSDFSEGKLTATGQQNANDTLILTMVNCVAHFEAKQWKPVAPPFKFPSEEEDPLDDPYHTGYSQFDDYEIHANPVHAEEHSSPSQTNPPHTEL